MHRHNEAAHRHAHTARRRMSEGSVIAALVSTAWLLLGFVQPDAPPGAWLETSPPDNWNTSAGVVPTAPPTRGVINPRCGGRERLPESAEEDQVVAAGWRLFNAARVGWSVRTVDGLVDYDGMCRPNQFQGFVFADGQFVGTISPAPMDSRVDGAGRVLDFQGDEILANFVRYTPNDALCCPSSTFLVRFQVDRSSDPPLLVPLSATRANPG